MPTPTTSFLPDFCANRNVFLIVLIAELLALVLALSNTIGRADFWPQLGALSLFVQWLALGSAAVLCWTKPFLRGLSTVQLTLLVYLLTQAVTLGLSALVLLGFAQLGASHLLPQEPVRFVLHSGAISSIVVLLALRYFYIHHQWQLNIQAQAEARLQALQARIRPHFLFNSLNTISSLIQTRPEQAENAVLDLADLFRLTLKGDAMVSLQEELDLCRGYLELETLRLGQRLHIDWQLAPDLPMDLPIPNLLLQPLLENAIYHGIEKIEQGGLITINISTDPHALQIRVENPPGVEPARAGSGIALDNIQRRLQTRYGEGGRLAIQSTETGFRVTVWLPLAAAKML